MENQVDTKIAKTTLGRKAADYAVKVKLGESPEFIDALKMSDARQYGYENVEQYQKELDSLAPKTAGKRELDQSFQIEFNVVSGRLWKAVRDSSDETVTNAMRELVEMSDKFPHPIDGAKRTDYRRMLIASVGNGRIQNYFGGWGDGSQHLRNQYGNGRLNPDASSNLDGDAITRDMEKVLKASSPYNNGQQVPAGKSSGYEIEQPTDESPASDPQNPEDAESLISDPASQDVTDDVEPQDTTESQDTTPKGELTACEKCGKKHQLGSNKWIAHNPS